ncbi:hypothetical protein [Breoghania sp. L-A4]|uniref:hypothetical protein n=1 Tax=Breoghania sp. L-A4 TaxID=2304600 RepID=UPI000E35BCCB|nr:hypothetical protein [Breoghania sp. L-A4]AXS40424.1 hypothetical protein D1F64_10590 [Breoghania sp. L-A4]
MAPLADRKARAPVARCDDLGCVLSAGLQAHAAPARAARAPPALHIAVPKTPQALPEDCRQADVIVAFFEVPDWCARSALVFDRTRLLRDGAAALYLAGPSDTRMPGGARDPVSKQPGPGTGAAMPLDADVPPLVRSARIETVRNGRHRPWHGAPAD